MRPATVVLALETALDVAAARRLHDYGALDDAGVARALEQVEMQRYGRLSLPVPLLRIVRLAAVVESGEDVRVIDLAGDESTLLTDLTAVWPARHGQTIDWAGDSAAIVSARAFAHDVCIARGLRDWSRIALIDCVDPQIGPRLHTAEKAEADWQLLHGQTQAADPRQPLLARAAQRYGSWLRWQFCQGLLTAAGRARRAQALETRLALHGVAAHG